MELVEIDSIAVGDGGGQVLRSAISLSAILGKPLRVLNIRAKRPNPGLQAQHITAINAVSRVADAETEGLARGSQEILFRPRKIEGGSFAFDIGTAGSVTLVMQALLPVLAFAKKESRVELIGGTNVAWSPTVHYIKNVFLPMLGKLGYSVDFSVGRYGWYPKGGGAISFRTVPMHEFAPLDLSIRGRLKRICGISCASNLPENVVQRQASSCRSLIKDIWIDTEVTNALCPGSAVTLWAEYENCILGSSSLGKLGKRSENVGMEASVELLEAMQGNACADKHMSDQLLLYMSLAEGTSRILTSGISEHVKTNIYVIQKFTGKEFKLENNLISVQGVGWSNGQSSVIGR